MIGKTFRNYHITEKIGAGGQGEVYKATDEKLGRSVVIKVLPAELTVRVANLKRFEREARLASSLDHPNICTIFDLDEVDGVHFIAMQHVEGKTVRQLVAGRPLELKTALLIGLQVADALAVAHGRGIIHRDIKSGNVMVTPEGQVKVLDFGLAKLLDENETSSTGIHQTELTEVGVPYGTATYAAPEQARGDRVDKRADIFSLGVLLYEMLTGTWPFRGKTTIDVRHAVLHDPAPPISGLRVSGIPDRLQKIVDRALEKEPADRFQNMEDFRNELRLVLQEVEGGIATLQRVTPEPPKHLPGANPISRAVDWLKSREKRFQNIKDSQFELARSKQISTSIDQTQVHTAKEIRAAGMLQADERSVSTKDAIVQTSTSAEYILYEIKNHKAIVLATLSIVLVASFGFVYWSRANRSTSINSRQISSIAVLPFENAGGTSEMEYFSDGMTESLINSLSQLPDTKVIARSSVFQYKGKSLDLPNIAKELGVEAVLNGRVVQRGDTLSVSVDLMDVRNNTHLWGQQFTQKSTDISVLQEEIARRVTESLRVRLTGVQEERIRKRYTYNEEAYKLYLQGRYYWNRRTVDDFKTAIPYFQKATEIDPNFALAYSGLADAYGLLGLYGGPPAFPQAKAAALKALALDDNLAEAHGSLGQYLIDHEHNFAAAEREFKRAIELNPNYASAYQWYAELLYHSGRFEESQKQAQRAVELDPLSRIINSVYARSFLFARRFDEAIAIFKKNIELNPDWYGDHVYLFHSYAAKAMYPEAVDAFLKYMTLARIAPPSEIKATQESFAKSGWQGFLLHRAKYLEGETGLKDQLAEFYSYLGEKDKAFAVLANEGGTKDLKYLSSFDNLRSDPRFSEFTRRFGFPE